jgi:hypothetical protein
MLLDVSHVDLARWGASAADPVRGTPRAAQEKEASLERAVRRVLT